MSRGTGDEPSRWRPSTGTVHPAAVAAAILVHGVALAALTFSVVPTPTPAADPVTVTLDVVPEPAQAANPIPLQASALPEPVLLVPPPAPEPVPPAEAATVPAAMAVVQPAPSAPAPAHVARRTVGPPPRVRAVSAIAEAAQAAQPVAAGAHEAAVPPAPAPVGPSWQALLSAWLQAHKTYPETARERDEQGTATMRFTVSRDGRVRSVQIAQGSGSSDLDLAATAMLRDAHVPAFPDSMIQPEVTVTVRIHYAIER